MKSEPDRLDFLIVLLPVILVGLLGFQTYEYIQMNRQRAGALPVSSAEPADAAPRPEPESPEAAPTEGEAAPAEPGDSGDAAADPLAADMQPDDAGADGAAAQGADQAAQDPVAAGSQGEDPAPDAGEPAAAQADQTPDAGEPAAAQADQTPDAGESAAAQADPTGEPAAAQVDQPAAEALPPTAADAEPGTVVADMPPVLEQPAAAAPAPDAVAGGDAQVLLRPQTNPAKVGELIAVDVLIEKASGVAGAVFHLRFDPAMLQLNEDPQSEMGPFFGDPEAGARFNATGLPNGRLVVSINVARDTEGRSGEGRLATFYFQVLAAGETRLDLLQSALRDAGNRPLAAVFTNVTLIIVE